MDNKLLNVKSFKTLYSALLMKFKSMIKKSDWNQNDKNADDYIKNRPFYDGRKIEEYIYQWDGNIDGKETIVLYNAIYAKVSDDVFPVSIYEDDYIDKQFWINFVETGELQAAPSGYVLEQVKGKLYFFETEFTAAIVALDNVEYEGVSYSKGVYLVSDKWGLYPSKFRVVVETGELKKLDKKYLPDDIGLMQSDWDQNDETSLDYVKNKPFWEEIKSVTNYLNEVNVYFYSDSTRYKSNYVGFDKTIIFKNNTDQIYTIIIDGIEYMGKIFDYENSMSMSVYKYNDSSSIVMDMTLDGSIAAIYGAKYITTSLQGDYHTISICVKDSVIHQLASKYIPSDSTKMDKRHPTGTGSFSMNRKQGTVIGYCSHAEGYDTEASGYYSHAEGCKTTASGYYSHAEGNNTTASGDYSSHAEGYETTASGNHSHAEGYNTIAYSDYQHVQGKYNIEDTENKHAHIVGNGTSDTERSNAHTVDWYGNAWYQGSVYVGGAGQDDDNAKKLATEEYVNTAITNSQKSSSLTTTNKTLVGAINELNSSKADIEYVDTAIANIDVEQVQSDWLQNNVTAKDYIRNRTHYTNVTKGDYVCLTTFEFDGINGVSASNSKIGFEIGKIYSVGISDGDLSELYCHAEELIIDDISIGIMVNGSFDNGTSFIIVDIYDEYVDMIGAPCIAERGDNNTWEQVVIYSTNEIVYKLDKKYIPDMNSITLLSPNGTRFSITVGDDGVLTATEITE